jgi:hypothetical protein
MEEEQAEEQIRVRLSRGMGCSMAKMCQWSSPRVDELAMMV